MNIIKSYLNEKFTEESDPIKDLGIGMMVQIKKWYSNKFNEQPFNKRHALLSSVSDGKVDFVEFLLLKNNIKDINYSDSILLRIAAYQEKEEIVKYLLKRGADINKAIINAEKHNEYQTKRNLLNIKGNINSYLNEKFTEDSDPIADMGIGIKGEMQRWLKSQGMKVFYPDRMLITCAAYGKTEYVKYLLKNGVGIHTGLEEALSTSSERGHVEVVKLLLDARADVHYDRDVALRLASYYGHIEIVKLLLNAGADVSANNYSSLRLANDKGHSEIIKLLSDAIEKNANTTHKIKKILGMNEKFTEENSDPIADMNIGLKHQILNDLKKIGVSENDIEFFDDYTFFSKRYDKKYEDNFIKIQLKYFPENKKQLIKKLLDPSKDIIEIINESIKDKIKKDEIMYIIKYFLEGSSWKNARGNDVSRDLKRARFYIEKLKRTPEKKKEEKENNIYVFIGYLDKSPVVVNGKKYFEEKLKAEKMVKIKDKYDINEMTQISMMKLRARVQYGGQTGSGVFMITVPKFMMDEDYYNDIPEEYYDIIEKYKVEI